MATKVRIISPRNSKAWDDLIATCVHQNLWRKTQTYFGIITEERADKIRRSLRTAGKHQGVAVHALWHECDGCKAGGPECRYHVDFTVYTMEEARAYKAKLAKAAH